MKTAIKKHHLKTRYALALPVLCLAVWLTLPAHAATDIWTGGGTSGNWSDANNWGGVAPNATGDNLIFAGTSQPATTNDLLTDANSVRLNTGTAFTFDGNALTLTAGLTNSAMSNSWNIATTLGAGQIFSAASGTSLAVNGVISGAQTLGYYGGGTFVIGGINTDSGNLTIDAATVHVNSGATLFCDGLGWSGRSVTIQNGGGLEAYTYANGSGNLWGQCGDGQQNIVFATGGGTFRMLGTSMANINKGIYVNSGVTGRFEVPTGISCSWPGSYSGRDFTVSSGGTLIFGGGGDFSTSRYISGAGNVEVADGGTLSLSNACSYSGSTIISAGTLALTGGSIDNSMAISIAAGATFDVSSSATYNLSIGTSLTAGGTGATVGSTAAAIKGGTTVNLGSQPVTLNYDGSNPALYISQGALVLSNNVITVNGTTLSVGVPYTIIQAAGGTITTNGTLAITGTAIPPGATATVSISGGDLQITLAATGLVWTGDYSSEWSTAILPSPKNWVNGPGGSPLDYINGTTVYFPDSSTNPAVNISTADVFPDVVNFSATSKAYTLGGTYGISGGASLVKSGAGVLTIDNANTYTNGTTLSGGQLNLNNGGSSAGNSAIGTGPLTITGGALDNTSGGDVTLSPAIAQNWNGNFSYLGSVNNLNLGAGAVALNTSSTVTVSSNTLAVDGVVSGAGNTLTKSGDGTLALNNDGNLAGINVSQGSFMHGTGTLALTGALSLNQTDASLVVTGGTTTVSGAFTIGNTVAGSVGALSVSGGALSIGGSFRAGNGLGDGSASGQNSTITQTGGSITINATNSSSGECVLGGNWGGTATVALSGGTLSVATYWGPALCQRGTNVVTISGTAAASFAPAANGGGGLALAGQAGSDCTLNLDGGSLTVARLGNGNGTGTINFNGGILKANASSTTFLQGLSSANVQDGGAVIDTSSNSITIAQDLLQGGGAGTGGLTKNGSGTLTLTGFSSYTGPTVVNAGGLVLNGALYSTNLLTIANNGSLSGSGSITGPVTLGSDTTLSGSLYCSDALMLGSNVTVTCASGTLTASSATFQDAATINIAASAYSMISLSSGLTNLGPAGSIVINITGAPLAVGTYNLIYAPTGIAGTGFSAFKLGTNPGGGNYVLEDDTATSGYIAVVVTTPQTWTGLFSTEWSTNVMGGSKNWQVAGTPADYTNGAAVLFDDTAVTNGLVTLANGNVFPGSVVFNNGSLAYDLEGSNGIGGTCGLNLNNYGLVNIATTNSFTGPVGIAGYGTLAVTSVADAGSPSALGAGTNIVLGGGTLGYTGGNAGTDRPFSLNTDSTIAISNSATSLTLSGVISGTANLTKDGPGALLLTANETFGSTYIANGTLQIGNGGGTGNFAGSVNNNATLVFDRTNTLAYAGAISGPGVVAQSGSGTTALNAANSYSGGTMVNSGTMQIGNNSALGSGMVTLNAGTLKFPSDGNNYSVANPITVATGSNAVISATGTYVGNWPTLTLTGIITNNGTLTLAGGPNGTGHDQLQIAGGFVGNAPSFTGHVRLLTTPCTWDSNAVITISGPNDVLELRSTSEVMPDSTTINVNDGRFMLNGVTATMTQTIEALNGSSSGFVSCDWGQNTLRIGAHDGSGSFAGTLQDGAPISNPQFVIEKIGAGTQIFGGTNTYSGTTTVSGGTLLINGTLGTNMVTVATNGTLGGIGTIAGPVTVNGTLAPGGLAALTINNNLTLNGTTVMQINRSLGTTAYDHVAGLGTVTYGGSLTVTNLAGTFAAGDRFVLFSAGTIVPGFTSVTLPTLSDSSLYWTNNLNVDGSITVVSTTAVNPNPTNITVTVSSGQLTLSWPADHTGWTLQAQTNNLSAGLTGTWYDVPNSTVTNKMTFDIIPTNPTVFYRLKY